MLSLPVSAHEAHKENTKPPAAGVKIGGDFTLTDQDGKKVKGSDFKGKYMLVFFGFTHCPDICPLTVSTMAKAHDLLGKKASEVAMLLITVDPERDTPAKMKEFLAPFGGRVTGLTGSMKEVKHTADVYKIFFSKTKPDPKTGDYAVDHSTIVYMMDRDGNYLRHFSYNIGEKDLAEGILEQLK